jgi:hypothetical protein
MPCASWRDAIGPPYAHGAGRLASAVQSGVPQLASRDVVVVAVLAVGHLAVVAGRDRCSSGGPAPGRGRGSADGFDDLARTLALRRWRKDPLMVPGRTETVTVQS